MYSYIYIHILIYTNEVPPITEIATVWPLPKILPRENCIAVCN